MTLAVMALYADGTTTLRNIASWRVKETDRIAAMATELRKLGATVEEGADFIRVTPPPPGAAGARQHPHLRRPPRGHVLFAGGLQPGRPAGAHRRPQMRGQDLSGLLRGPVLGGPGRCPAIPVICIDGPPPRARARWPVEWPSAWATTFLDSGALYRITALAALRGLALMPLPTKRSHCHAIGRRSLPVRFEAGRMLLGGDDVTDAIRTEEAGMNASRVSALPAVRAALVDCSTAFSACRAWWPTGATWAP
jgi:3-phosphoshikimate 1-carboxyvinyltransferase